MLANTEAAIRDRLSRRWITGLQPQSAIRQFDEALHQIHRIDGLLKISADEPLNALFRLLAAQTLGRGCLVITRTWPESLWANSPDPEFAPLEKGQVGIATGGSGGKLRFALHDWHTLAAAVDGYQAFFKCETLDVVNMLPLHHTAGLVACLRSYMTGGCLALADWKVTQAGADYTTAPGVRSHISLVPTQLGRLLDNAQAVCWLQQFAAVIVGGAACPRKLVAQALALEIPIFLSYGMTEAAGTIALAGRPELLSKASSPAGRVLPHLQVCIDDGEICLSGPSLFSGYWGQGRRSTDFFRTGDQGGWAGEGLLRVHGRDGRWIISGGEKVDPCFVEEVIRDTGLCQDVHVLGIDDAEWGQRVAAVIVASKTDLRFIEERLERLLPAFMRPRQYCSVQMIPRNAMGKVDHRKVVDLLIRQSP